jgi:nucleoside-diphosphate-sugar epimerase
LQWLYIDDLVHSLIEAGTRPRAAGVTVNVAGADLFSVYELMTAAGRARGGDGGAPHPDGGTGLAAPWEPPDMLRFSIAAAADVLDFAPTPIEEALPASLPGDVGG